MKNEEKIKEAISNGDLEYLKSEIKNGVDINLANDYYLYLAVFFNQEVITKYLIEIGLDPEKTKGRLEMSDPEGLEKIRKLKKIKEFVKQLDSKLENKVLKIKINKI